MTHCDSGPNHEKDMVANEQWDSLVTQHQATNRALKHLSDKHTIIHTLEAFPLAEGARARVFYNSRSQAVYMVVDSLAKPDPNEAYVIWSYNKQDVPTRLGAINMDQLQHPQPFGRVADPAIFAISRETLPLPNAPSPERIQCAVRLADSE